MKPKLNKTEKLAFGASMSMTLASFAVMLTSRLTYDLSWEMFAHNLPLVFIGEVVVLFSVLVCAALGRYLLKHHSFGILETRLALLLDGWRQRIALKNAGQIAPALQLFLYCVLRRNQEILQIPVGSDAACLSPNGWRTVYRKRTAYFMFETVLNAPPEQEIPVLTQLLNQFIIAELNNYGIEGLSSFYYTPQKCYPSVFLDRLTYDEVRKCLIFELLFISSEPALHAYESAVQRNRAQSEPQIEPEVFDDEITPLRGL